MRGGFGRPACFWLAQRGGKPGEEEVEAVEFGGTFGRSGIRGPAGQWCASPRGARSQPDAYRVQQGATTATDPGHTSAASRLLLWLLISLVLIATALAVSHAGGRRLSRP